MKGRTIFLQLVLAVVGVATIAIAAIPVPIMLHRLVTTAPPVAVGPAWSFVVGMMILILAFLVAVGLAEGLLRVIARGQAFSPQALRLLIELKWAVGVMAVGAICWLPLVYCFAQLDDAPGVVLIGSAIVAIPVVISVFLAILQRLWAAALAYKTDSDFTI